MYFNVWHLLRDYNKGAVNNMMITVDEYEPEVKIPHHQTKKKENW